jgi:hypothetical protein
VTLLSNPDIRPETTTVVVLQARMGVLPSGPSSLKNPCLLTTEFALDAVGGAR